MKKASFISNSKRLVLKNPANTAKIKILLEMFPNAKFIHIYRNPYTVYLSRKNASKKFGSNLRLQYISELEVDANILESYQKQMIFFLSHKALIPEENFVEIKYEDFLGNELIYIQKIYEQFQLPDFEQSKEYFHQYLIAHSDYQTNKHLFDNETITKVYDAWKFTIDQWQYNPPQ
ncbi:hypothetical protein GTQ43_38110 [Nostoc sp. KVJ3]|uniref:sulfotransferase family protein n=1 Tax=Nostoc sp. KVJ3 TaxID=457945 RepID=UPI0022370D47|nr:sulfotransferase [Nostoc sp. KVJ3]MCW5319205.1 hypothetical protein [Nostoc sp. KVJ3]